MAVAAAWVASLPKAELHLHLEGSVDAAMAQRLAQRHGVHAPRYPPPGQGFADFKQFLECYKAICACLVDPSDFSDAVDSLAQRLSAQGVVYAEVTVTPMAHVSRGVAQDVVLEGLARGRALAAGRGVRLHWVFDVVRTLPQWGEGTLRAALAMNDGDPNAVIGFGVGGPERDHDDPRDHADVFASARVAGLHSVPHAGEQAGPGSIWGALEVLGAERIGHGVRCVEDPTLVAYLVRQRVPLEVCPTSNVNLGVVPSLREHMLPRLVADGVLVSIGSDDPPLFGTDLQTEFVRICDAFGWGPTQVVQLCAASFEHAFIDTATRDRYLAELLAASNAEP